MTMKAETPGGRHLTLDTPDALEYGRITDPEPEK